MQPEDMKKEIERLRLVIKQVQDIDATMGIYPQAMEDCDKEKSYKERDGFKNGWNSCVIEYGIRFVQATERTWTDQDNYIFLLLTFAGAFYQKGVLALNMNDTFDYACADVEDIPPDKIKEVANLFLRYGCDAILYWVAEQRGCDPNIPEYAKAVRRIRKLVRHDKSMWQRLKELVSWIRN